MYLYVETWNVTQKWMDLSKEDRRAFLDKVNEGIKELMGAGVENVGWAMNDEHTPYRNDYRYTSVWKMPSIEMVEEFEKAVADSGWHDYFSQANSRGQILPMATAIDTLVNLEDNSTSLLE